MQPLIITCAPVGAEVTLDQTPHLPYTPAKLGETARAIREAGASIIHVHCRTDDGTNTHEIGRFKQAYDAIRGASDLIVQFSTGGAIGMTPEERASILQLRPEMATLTCGTVNFGDDVFENSFPIMRGILAKMQLHGVRPELEIFDKGHHRQRAAPRERRAADVSAARRLRARRPRRARGDGAQSDAIWSDDLPAGLHLVGGRHRSRRKPRWRPSPQSRWAATSAWD
jgi:uncharacterized protein (DUF849 family)